MANKWQPNPKGWPPSGKGWCKRRVLQGRQSAYQQTRAGVVPGFTLVELDGLDEGVTPRRVVRPLDASDIEQRQVPVLAAAVAFLKVNLEVG